MPTARFKIYVPSEGDTTVSDGLYAQLPMILCIDPETGRGPEGYGYTWEKRLSDTHAQIWIRTSEEVMEMIKAQFSSPELAALGFEHLEDIEEPVIEEPVIEEPMEETPAE